MPELRQKQTAIRDWLEEYHSTAGADVGVCMEVFDGLLEGPLNKATALNELLDLLRVLEGLSPDPRTVCCAMLFVARSHGEDMSRWQGRLPKGVPAQLNSLLKLQQVQSENLAPGGWASMGSCARKRLRSAAIAAAVW